MSPPVDDGANVILLVGTDSRTDLQGNPLPTSVLTRLRTQWDAGLNTDTLIVLRIPNNGAPAYAISIPRDSYVSVPELGMTKVNGADGLTCGVPISDLAVHWDDARSKEMFDHIQQDDTAGIGKDLCTPSGLAR